MPYPQSASPQGPYPYAQGAPENADLPSQLRLALEQAAARMVGEEPAPVDPHVAAEQQARPRFGQQARPNAGYALPGIDEVVSRLMADPRLAAHLAGQTDQDGEDEDLGPADFGPPPYDPVERLKWDVAHTVHRNLMGARRTRKDRSDRRARARQAGNREFLNALAQADPLFRRTYSLLLDYLRNQPPDVQSRLIPQLDQDPRRFLELYGHMRHFIGRATANAAPQAGPAPGEPGRTMDASAAEDSAQPDLAPQDPRAAVRRALAGRMAAPALENPGALEDARPQASRQAGLAALKARMNAQGAGPGDLERYLELLGVGERMVR